MGDGGAVLLTGARGEEELAVSPGLARGVDYSLGAARGQDQGGSPPSGRVTLVQGLGARPVGSAAKEPPPPARPGRKTRRFPFPRTSAPAPGDRAGCPSLTGPARRLAQPGASLSPDRRSPDRRSLTPTAVLTLPGASGHKLQGLEPVQDGET